MKTLLVLSMAIATAATALTCGDYASSRDLSFADLYCNGQFSLTLDDLTRKAVSSDKAEAEAGIRMLRARGPEGLRALLEANAAVLKERTTKLSRLIPAPPDESWERIGAALDGVSGQHDCYASQLYWYTDFEQAKAAAEAQAKPILSLRLLGKLDEEFSCANSRFFRTTLYANVEVSQYLRDNFILHWKSVRPVPRVTIDFGDGRKLERTITGNSIHYVLAADGSVIDALPGLYGPRAFVRGLQQAEQIAQRSSVTDITQRMAMLSEYHRSRIAALNFELEADLQGLPPATSLNSSTILQFASLNPTTLPPTAQEAAKLTNSKRLLEAPVLDRSLPRSGLKESTAAEIDDATWSKVAALHQEDAQLDDSAVKLIRAKNPTAFDARRAAFAKTVVEDPLLRQIRNLQRSIAEDTVRNEYLLHPKIHAWLADGETNVDELNRKVYAELFLTPDSDPWLGLLSPDTFTALENNGVAQVDGGNSKTTTATATGL